MHCICKHLYIRVCVSARAYREMTNFLVFEFPFQRFRYQEHKSITHKEPSYPDSGVCIGTMLSRTSSTLCIHHQKVYTS